MPVETFANVSKADCGGASTFLLVLKTGSGADAGRN